MNNYKIKAGFEAVRLFSYLGYDVSGLSKESEFLFAKAKDMSVYNYVLEEKGYKELTLQQLRDLVAQSKNEQGLISGADAKLAWANGENVQILCAFDEFCTITTNLALSIFDDPKNKFRIKPRTIKLELEIPAPFEPKEGEEFFILSPLSATGYTKVQGITTQVLLDEYVKLGAWRTEEEIKQVVAALRGIKG